MIFGTVSIERIFLILLVTIGCFAKSETLFKLECNSEIDKSCTLSSKEDGEVKAKHVICIDNECKESLLFSDNHIFACQQLTKKSGDCQKIQIKNVQPFQSALNDLYQTNMEQQTNSENMNLNSLSDIDQLTNPIIRLFEAKRNLPFEALNYGRKRRSLPFEVLNYGKRSLNQNCDCSNQLKRALPYESILYGKRAIPFESLNYGKRAFIPIDGYIMGKREE
ncbi:unnamed protein product [Brachionus calyciflorus]|uniref:Uncharacterized protein n=1 Tax=Brachionus calyciflorus TaxID=104777 RepID=A0A814IC97_9BILA|nr:unnamed protein product [Brachionus calyciflorus]